MALSPALAAAITKFEAGFSAFVAATYSGAKVTFAVAAGATATMATIDYTVKGGGAFFKGSDSFHTGALTVPSPEAGAGMSFLVIIPLFMLFRMWYARNSSAK